MNSINCSICFDKLKATRGGKETNWTKRCITCKDSWVCGNCFHQWDNTIDTSNCYKVMPCVLCKHPMNYSNLVSRFNEGTGISWRDDINENKPIWEYLYKIEENEK